MLAYFGISIGNQDVVILSYSTVTLIKIGIKMIEL